MARASFFEDFFGKGGALNANLFDLALCTAPGDAKIEVLSSGTADLNGTGFLQILPYGQTGTIPSCSNAHYCSAILTSPEIKAKKLPTVGAVLLFRDTYPLEKLQALVGFTTVGQDGHAASDIIALRLKNAANESNAFEAVFKKSGSDVSGTPISTGVKPKEFQPIHLEISLTPDGAMYMIDGRVVASVTAAAPTAAMNFEILLAIYNSTTNITKEMLVDYAYGSLER